MALRLLRLAGTMPSAAPPSLDVLPAVPVSSTSARPVPRPIAWNDIARLLLALAMLLIGWQFIHAPDGQNDLRIYYASAKLWAAGFNPYDPRSLLPFFPSPSGLAYVYPPDTLWLFHLVTALPIAVVRPLYLTLQLGLLAALYACWQRVFLPPADRASAWFAVFCGFGLGGSLLTELSAGNVSLLEQTFLWFGLAAYLRGRPGAFCVLLWLAASFKLTLLAFSGLLLVGPARQWGKFALVWTAMAARLTLCYLANPVLFAGFIAGLRHLQANPEEDGGNDPSVLHFFGDVARLILGPDDPDTVRVVVLVLYGLTAAAVLPLTFLAWRTIQRRARADGGNDAARAFPLGGDRGILLVCLYAVAYGLLVPRLKVYSCLLLLLPVWRLARHSLAGKGHAWLTLIAVGSLSNRSDCFGVEAVYAFLWRYQAIVLSFAAWAFFVHATLRPSAPPPRTPPPRPLAPPENAPPHGIIPGFARG